MDWKSYDSAAAAHERIRVPLLFAAPARDLIARMAFEAADSVLDVGTGSGAVARASACPKVVGVDPSLEMVKVARESGVSRVAAAAVPGLPFAAESFDRVTAGFVLSHVQRLCEALADMVRVLRRGGLLGATAWAHRGSEHADVWSSVIERFAGRESLDAASRNAVPWEALLSRDGGLREALAAAGLREIRVDRLSYPIRMSVEAFLEMRETSTAARYLRSQTDTGGWDRFREAVAREFQARFEDPIEQTWTAWIAVGRK